jgi:hypothetical protein
VENFSFGRQFRIVERISLNIRSEFTNAFNRAYLSDPTISGVGISPQTALYAVNGQNQRVLPRIADRQRLRIDRYLVSALSAADGPACRTNPMLPPTQFEYESLVARVRCGMISIHVVRSNV